VKEADVHVRSEHVDGCERRISQARDRTAVMQKFVAALSHDFEPAPRDVPQFGRPSNASMHRCVDRARQGR
jgi:hypothetical protein